MKIIIIIMIVWSAPSDHIELGLFAPRSLRSSARGLLVYLPMLSATSQSRKLCLCRNHRGEPSLLGLLHELLSLSLPQFHKRMKVILFVSGSSNLGHEHC